MADQMQPGARAFGVQRKPGAMVAVMLAVCLVLPGCSTVKGIFNKEKPVNLKGERVSVLELDQRLEADPRLSEVPVQLPQPYDNKAWPEPAGYASHAMYHLAAADKLSRAWRTSVGLGADKNTPIMAPPIVAEGMLFALDAAAHVTALDAKTGRRLWRKSLVPRKSRKRDGFGGGLAYDGGRLFVATGFGNIHALDPKTGKQIWIQKIGVPFHASPTADEGRIFAVSHDNELHVLSQDDGHELWTQQAITEQASLLASASPAVSGDTVIVPYSSGELYAYRVQNGSTAWFDSLTRAARLTAMSSINDIAGSPVIDRDRVYAISHEGRLVAIDIHSGERIWTRDIGGIEMPWTAGDYIYVVTKEAQLLCISAKNGQIRWMTQLRRYVKPKKAFHRAIVVWNGPVLAGDKLILTSTVGRAVSVSPYTGQVLGQIKISGPSSITPIVANDTVYVMTDNAKVQALR